MSEPEKMSDRLLMIATFVEDTPDSEFQWGYLTALMEEAVEDIEEAGSDIFDKALDIFREEGSDRDSLAARNWTARRIKTLG